MKTCRGAKAYSKTGTRKAEANRFALHFKKSLAYQRFLQHTRKQKSASRTRLRWQELWRHTSKAPNTNMELHSLIIKIRDGSPLSQEEREHMIITLDAELRIVRDKDPKAYLNLLNLIIDAMRRASSQLGA